MIIILVAVVIIFVILGSTIYHFIFKEEDEKNK